MPKGHAIQIAKFDEPDETWARNGDIWTRMVFIGPANNPNSPLGIAIKAGRDVGDFVAGKCSFATTTALTVLSGTVMHDGRWMTVGDMYMAPPGDVNGDLMFGSEGAVIFIMFDKRSGIVPTFASPRDQAEFDKHLRGEVEEVASGRVEKSVPILPLRNEPIRGRAIVLMSQEEVAEYRRVTGTEW